MTNPTMKKQKPMKNHFEPIASILNEEQMLGSFSSSVKHFLDNGYIFDGPANDYSNMTSHCVLRGVAPETRNSFVLVELDRPCFYSGDDEPAARTFGIYKYVGKRHWNSVDRRHPTETLLEETFYAIGSREEKGAWTADKEFAKRCKELHYERNKQRFISGRKPLNLLNPKVEAIVLNIARRLPKMKSLQKRHIKEAYWSRTGMDCNGSLILHFETDRGDGKKRWEETFITKKRIARWGEISPKRIHKAVEYYKKNPGLLNGEEPTALNISRKIAKNAGWIGFD